MTDLTGTIREMTRRLGHPPTYDELAVELGVSPSAVRKRLTKLRSEGRVTWEPGKRRTLRANAKGRSWPM